MDHSKIDEASLNIETHFLYVNVLCECTMCTWIHMYTHEGQRTNFSRDSLPSLRPSWSPEQTLVLRLQSERLTLVSPVPLSPLSYSVGQPFAGLLGQGRRVDFGLVAG